MVAAGIDKPIITHQDRLHLAHSNLSSPNETLLWNSWQSLIIFGVCEIVSHLNQSYIRSCWQKSTAWPWSGNSSHMQISCLCYHRVHHILIIIRRDMAVVLWHFGEIQHRITPRLKSTQWEESECSATASQEYQQIIKTSLTSTNGAFWFNCTINASQTLKGYRDRSDTENGISLCPFPSLFVLYPLFLPR